MCGKYEWASDIDDSLFFRKSSSNSKLNIYSLILQVSLELHYYAFASNGRENTEG